MKKVLLVAICALLLVCLCACQEENLYDELNKVVSGAYAQVDVSVQITKGNDQLNSTFVVKNQDGKSIIDYHIEKFAQISADKVPDDYKTEQNGTVEVVGNQVTGDVLSDVSFQNIAKAPYRFNADYFADAKFENGVFTAKVVSATNFAADNLLKCTDMTVSFKYQAAEKVLQINYVLDGGVSVQIVYTMK